LKNSWKDKVSKNHKKLGQALLEPLPVETDTDKEKASKAEVQVIKVTGEAITRYAKAASEKKTAEDEMKKLKPVIVKPALEEIFERNCAEPGKALTSVRLIDEKGGAATISFQCRYGDIEDEDQTLKDLAALGVKDPNKYLAYNVRALFNARLLYNLDGALNVDLYERLREAIQQVENEFSLGTTEETKLLSMARVVSVKPSFHADRWRDFDEEQQAVLTKVLPNVVTVTPVAAEKPKKGLENK
jgi:hypothetical protein